ncbi:MAG: DUF998 domain-containing protein [Treponema sp.]|nr:DUF998 domain-containing protein [Treponema sp.]
MKTDPTKEIIREIIRTYQDRILGLTFIVLIPSAILLGLPTSQYTIPSWWHSVSQTYYAADSAVMTGMLCICGIMFITHRSSKLFERVMFVIAGIATLGVVACPHGEEYFERVGLFHLQNTTSGIFHIIFASIMFLAFGILSFFNFPETAEELRNSKHGRQRNRIYRINGIIIFIACILMALRQLYPTYDWIGIIVEFFIFTPFGINMMIKANMFKTLKD